MSVTLIVASSLFPAQQLAPLTVSGNSVQGYVKGEEEIKAEPFDLPIFYTDNGNSPTWVLLAKSGSASLAGVAANGNCLSQGEVQLTNSGGSITKAYVYGHATSQAACSAQGNRTVARMDAGRYDNAQGTSSKAVCLEILVGSNNPVQQVYVYSYVSADLQVSGSAGGDASAQAKANAKAYGAGFVAAGQPLIEVTGHFHTGPINPGATIIWANNYYDEAGVPQTTIGTISPPFNDPWSNEYITSFTARTPQRHDTPYVAGNEGFAKNGVSDLQSQGIPISAGSASGFANASAGSEVYAKP